MNYSQEIREIFNGFKTNETIFLSDNQFTEKEIQIFSDKDKLSIAVTSTITSKCLNLTNLRGSIELKFSLGER